MRRKLKLKDPAKIKFDEVVDRKAVFANGQRVRKEKQAVFASDFEKAREDLKARNKSKAEAE